MPNPHTTTSPPSWWNLPALVLGIYTALTDNTSHLENIMATLAELQSAIDELNTTIAAERQQVQDGITALNTSIANLEAQIATLPTADALQPLVDGVKAASAAVSGIYTPPEA